MQLDLENKGRIGNIILQESTHHLYTKEKIRKI
jgi:hypothetical protein